MDYSAAGIQRNTEQNTNSDYDRLKQQFVTDVYTKFGESKDEISQRNSYIEERDAYIYGDYLMRAANIPPGHDFTPANWLRRSVEIHKNLFMGRGFQVISTYNTKDTDNAPDDTAKQQIQLENEKQKSYAEQRGELIKSIIEDNGGETFWTALAENASAVGDAALMMYWDEDDDKIELCQIENMENLYVLWNNSDFRKVDAYAYVFQVSKQKAISEYGAPENVPTSPMGAPLNVLGLTSSSAVSPSLSLRPMVTIMEVTGEVEGWAIQNGKLVQVAVGKETPLNVKIVGNEIRRLISDEKKIPKYYLLPNKRVRRRPWGVSDISESAIRILVTYIETLSDWRTVAAKVNFPKYKGLGFGPDTQMPKYESRKVQILPLSENQDLQELNQGDANGLDWGRQLEELEKLFMREVSVAAVLFTDPSVGLNSNQALTTSMKPTTDVAEAKKQLWTPILMELFNDALNLLAVNKPDIKEVVDETDQWRLKIIWPSIMDKEDPIYQQMLMNRFNSGTMSVQSYIEAQGESKEEIDRIRDEINDPITAAILSHGLPEVARKAIYSFMGMPPWGYITPKVSLKGDLAPQEVGNMAHNYQWDQGPYGPNIGPTGNSGQTANDNFMNTDFTSGNPSTIQPQYQSPNQQSGQAPAQVTTPANNQPGQGVASQPGSGATTTSPQGAINQTNQQNGQ